MPPRRRSSSTTLPPPPPPPVYLGGNPGHANAMQDASPLQRDRRSRERLKYELFSPELVLEGTADSPHSVTKGGENFSRVVTITTTPGRPPLHVLGLMSQAPVNSLGAIRMSDQTLSDFKQRVGYLIERALQDYKFRNDHHRPIATAVNYQNIIVPADDLQAGVRVDHRVIKHTDLVPATARNQDINQDDLMGMTAIAFVKAVTGVDFPDAQWGHVLARCYGDGLQDFSNLLVQGAGAGNRYFSAIENPLMEWIKENKQDVTVEVMSKFLPITKDGQIVAFCTLIPVEQSYKLTFQNGKSLTFGPIFPSKIGFEASRDLCRIIIRRYIDCRAKDIPIKAKNRRIKDMFGQMQQAQEPEENYEMAEQANGDMLVQLPQAQVISSDDDDDYLVAPDFPDAPPRRAARSLPFDDDNGPLPPAAAAAGSSSTTAAVTAALQRKPGRVDLQQFVYQPQPKQPDGRKRLAEDGGLPSNKMTTVQARRAGRAKTPEPSTVPPVPGQETWLMQHQQVFPVPGSLLGAAPHTPPGAAQQQAAFQLQPWNGNITY